MRNKISLNEFDSIIFDLGGVILNLDYDRTINEFKKLGGIKFNQLFTQATQDKIIDRFETGDISTPEFLNYMQKYLPQQVSHETICQAWNAMLLDLPKSRLDFLLELKKTHRIFLFSNTNEIHYDFFTSQADLKYNNPMILDTIFEQTYFSHTAKVRKPESAAFRLVIDNHKLNVTKTLFIDDSIQHIEGAKNIGLQTYHLVHEDIINIFDTSND
jgi:glucose-1-phosphatase